MALNFSIADKQHAITQFQATLNFAAAVGADGSNETSQILADVAANLDLPARLITPSIRFEFSGGGLPPTPPQVSSENGYQRFNPDGKVSARVSSDGQSISYMSATYEGWDGLEARLVETFARLSEPALKRSIPISRVTLQYFNEFSSKGAGYINSSEIFRVGTPWISGIATTSEDLWHSHIGQFEQDGDSKRLVNVNTDVVLASAAGREDYTQVNVMIFAGHLFDVPGTKPLLILPEERKDKLKKLLNDAHDLEKRILSETLSDNYLTEIGAK